MAGSRNRRVVPNQSTATRFLFKSVSLSHGTNARRPQVKTEIIRRFELPSHTYNPSCRKMSLPRTAFGMRIHSAEKRITVDTGNIHFSTSDRRLT